MGEVHELRAEVDRLSRQVRRLRRAGGALALCAGAVLIMAQTRGPATIEAREIIVKDAAGKVRAAVKVYQDEATYGTGAFLVLNDAAGKPLVSIGGDRSAAGLCVLNADGGARGCFGFDGAQTNAILVDRGGSGAAAGLSVGPDGPGLMLKDGEGNVVFAKP